MNAERLNVDRFAISASTRASECSDVWPRSLRAAT